MKALSDDTQINLSFRYVLMLIGVSASFAFGYGKLMGDINDLKFKVAMSENQLRELKEWKDFWVTDGELPLDREQTTKIMRNEADLQRLLHEVFKEDKENKPVLNLDGKEYEIEKMDDDQKVMVSHIADLNRKIETASFNLQQLQFGRQAFIDALSKGLKDGNKD